MRTRFGATYWRNIARAAAGMAAAGLVVVVVAMIVLSARAADGALNPPRIPLRQTPRDVGIEAYDQVWMTTVDGIRLEGWYIPPRIDNSTAIILAHGYANNRTQLLPEAQILAEAGYGVLLFDFRGHGESSAALVTIGDHERRDLEAAIAFVASQPNVSRIGALGFSMGGAVLAQVAAEDPRIDAVVIEAAFPTLVDEIRYRARVFGPLSQLPAMWVMRQAGIDMEGVRPIDDLCAIAPRPVLLIYGKLDADVPPGTPQRMLAAACDPVELWVIAGLGHDHPVAVVREEYAARLVAFFANR